jgi:hypothetical protein
MSRPDPMLLLDDEPDGPPLHARMALLVLPLPKLSNEPKFNTLDRLHPEVHDLAWSALRRVPPSGVTLAIRLLRGQAAGKKARTLEAELHRTHGSDHPLLTTPVPPITLDADSPRDAELIAALAPGERVQTKRSRGRPHVPKKSSGLALPTDLIEQLMRLPVEESDPDDLDSPPIRTRELMADLLEESAKASRQSGWLKHLFIIAAWRACRVGARKGARGALEEMGFGKNPSLERSIRDALLKLERAAEQKPSPDAVRLLDSAVARKPDFEGKMPDEAWRKRVLGDSPTFGDDIWFNAAWAWVSRFR